jgi:hypothetical protein
LSHDTRKCPKLNQQKFVGLVGLAQTPFQDVQHVFLFCEGSGRELSDTKEEATEQEHKSETIGKVGTCLDTGQVTWVDTFMKRFSLLGCQEASSYSPTTPSDRPPQYLTMTNTREPPLQQMIQMTMDSSHPLEQSIATLDLEDAFQPSLASFSVEDYSGASASVAESQYTVFTMDTSQ